MANTNLVRDAVANAIKGREGNVLSPKLIAVALCKEHEDECSSVFAKSCMYQAIRILAAKMINAIPKDLETIVDTNQLSFDGMKDVKVQKYYLHERDGEIVAVPVLKQTKTEFMAKIKMYRNNIKGLQRHIKDYTKVMNALYPIKAKTDV